LATIRIHGGKPLQGDIPISGSKNASLPLLAAALMVPGTSIIENVPRIDDIHAMIEMLRALGVRCEFIEPSTLSINAEHITSHSAPYDLVRKMRGSFYVAGALLGRFGEAEVPLPGGCVIGSRPVDFHIDGFKRLGALVQERHGIMRATAQKLTGSHIIMDSRYRSVGATVNIMLASALAEGVTIIENASREPEVVCCQRFLEAAGADIRGIGTDIVVITGVRELHDVQFRSIPDRMEAGTYLIACSAARGDITLHDAEPRHMSLVLDKLRGVGVRVETGHDWVRVRTDRRPLAFEVTTAPYPGFPTDLQPNAAVLGALAVGTSVVEETIFDARFNYADELNRMGADITLRDSVAIIRGVPRLYGAPVVATDIRAGSALVVAGLCADGYTEISGVEFLYRGYENLEEKLLGVGAAIHRADDEPHDGAHDAQSR
jgi:UDP-N-acetylglucosamine 1-carboxyvinyltransferase